MPHLVAVAVVAVAVLSTHARLLLAPREIGAPVALLVVGVVTALLVPWRRRTESQLVVGVVTARLAPLRI